MDINMRQSHFKISTFCYDRAKIVYDLYYCLAGLGEGRAMKRPKVWNIRVHMLVLAVVCLVLAAVTWLIPSRWCRIS